MFDGSQNGQLPEGDGPFLRDDQLASSAIIRSWFSGDYTGDRVAVSFVQKSPAVWWMRYALSA
nr:hypothetical protein Ade03nite_84950 [Actinoplanes derwentensis]